MSERGLKGGPGPKLLTRGVTKSKGRLNHNTKRGLVEKWGDLL